ncbi:site-specific tyrosine recombinase/integron integrase [Desulfotruncus alcoholivorax]|uniref:site-specific tyrosine recombinase/integron integrase n=1 Tax=Desulfotruncus alcoholivorax TaxID=265477 RepID=UPI0003F9D135|nr:site-specific tyrosine recombinase/integron integrase [Desulfotruncus alcoholivorax]
MKKTTEMIEHFFKDNQARFTEKTVKSYQIALRQFFSFCFKEYDEVKALDIRAWLMQLDETGLMPRSLRLKLAAVKSFYRYCIEEDLILKDPTFNIELPRIKESPPIYLNKADLAHLMEEAKEHPRERAIIETLYATGVRISELLNIRLEDIKWDTRQIWIRKGKGDKERFVLFTAACAERLKAYLATRKVESPYLFTNQRGKPLSPAWVELFLKHYTNNLDLGIKITPHTLRHTFAAHLKEKDMPQSYIQELLGHANINSTRIYNRLSATAKKKQYENYQ